ncbi:MAG: geranylgeranyl pyrophosphate synthetase [Cyphobasidiales sp. Tagirdzhanova-0007]|nr:MAG: geranylgeranyl pyrophosphate synthetase [Cyphobasidiales sp. Tagirdzhanova-0007]
MQPGLHPIVQASTSSPINGNGHAHVKASSNGVWAGDPALYDDFLNKLQGSPSARWPADKEATLLEPYSYLAATPGKDMRAQLIDAFNVWLKVPRESIEIVKQVVGQLHTASLLMDDVEDDSILRRGSPVAHKIFGIPQTINCANYVYFLAYQQLGLLQSARSHSQGGSANLLEIVNDELLNLHRGQGMDLYWRDSLTCPTEQEYIDMVSNTLEETGGLFRIAIRLMEATSSQPDKGAYVPLVNLIGVLFQIADDYLNLQSDAYKQNKGFCEDLTEGKFSFPIVHSIRADTTNQRLLNVLRQRPTDDSLKSYAVFYMENNTRSFDYTRQVLGKLDQQARIEIERLGGNEGLTRFLDKMLAGMVGIESGDIVGSLTNGQSGAKAMV